tara:strand:- start:48 stop:383 length:336 start_codon:yes stop_codon:yes gene_type:complete
VTATTPSEAPDAVESSITLTKQSMSNKQKTSTLEQESKFFADATTTNKLIRANISTLCKDQSNFCFESKLIHANISIDKTLVDITRKPYPADWATLFSKNPGNPPLCLLKQ